MGSDSNREDPTWTPAHCARAHTANESGATTAHQGDGAPASSASARYAAFLSRSSHRSSRSPEAVATALVPASTRHDVEGNASKGLATFAGTATSPSRLASASTNWNTASSWRRCLAVRWRRMSMCITSTAIRATIGSRTSSCSVLRSTRSCTVNRRGFGHDRSAWTSSASGAGSRTKCNRTRLARASSARTHAASLFCISAIERRSESSRPDVHERCPAGRLSY